MLENLFGGKRNLFWVVFAGVGLTLIGISFFVILYIGETVLEDDMQVEDQLSSIYVNFSENADPYVSAESYLAMGEYQQQFPEPQNVQVLEGLNTTEVIGSMLSLFSAGLGVDCTHCHVLDNFAAEEWDDPVAMENRATARIHLRMTQDLNQNWIGLLGDLPTDKQPSGVNMTCATCHYGQAQPVIWPQDQNALPDDFRLPLEQEFSMEEEGWLNVNARTDISLDHVQQQQYVMYHMNASMNVGCTHCHNSRYFPSDEVPAIYYANNMLLMSQYIWNEYGDTMNGEMPSCSLCHNGAVIPDGAALNASVIPAVISTDPDGNMGDMSSGG